MPTFETSSEEETREVGRQFARLLPERGLVLLIGNLGAGKTMFAKGIVEGLGVGSADQVTSPTYTIIHEYGEPARVYHIDLYRLDTAEEVVGLGIDDLLDSPVLLLVEWGERFPGLFQQSRFEVRIETSGDCSRSIQIDQRFS